MYDYLLDIAEPDPIAPSHGVLSEAERSSTGVFTTRYQKERQRVYDWAKHMVQSVGHHPHREAEDAKAEAALVGGQARISRAQGDQLVWVKNMLRHSMAARKGYRTPVHMVAAMIDAPRSVARELVYLAERLDDTCIEAIRAGEVSYGRVSEETRLREAGASEEEIEATRDLDLDKVKRVLQQRREMTRHDERKLFEGQYLAMQPSLDGTHMRVMGKLGAYEGEICRKALNQLGDRLIPAAETRPDPGYRRALAFTALCLDELDPEPAPAEGSTDHQLSGNRREPLLMVVANYPLAEESGFEQGAAVLAGARVGPDTIDLITCQGRVENITVRGQDITHHASTSAIRP